MDDLTFCSSTFCACCGRLYAEMRDKEWTQADRDAHFAKCINVQIERVNAKLKEKNNG